MNKLELKECPGMEFENKKYLIKLIGADEIIEHEGYISLHEQIKGFIDIYSLTKKEVLTINIRFILTIEEVKQ